MEYFYDPNGNTTSMFDSRLNIGNGSFSWQYDVLNQMTGEKSMAVLTRLYEYQYAFDAAGNRTQMSYYNGSTTVNTYYSHNDGNQLTIRSNGPQWGYTYDANGNMTIEDLEGTPQRTFSWNRDDRLTQVVKSGQTVQYTYDAMGRRLMKHVPVTNTSTLYFYEGLTVIAEKEKVGSGSWTWKRVFTIAPGVIGQILRVSENTGSVWADTYYHYDAIGNVALHTVSDGSPVQPFDQDAYGNIRLGSQSGYHLTTKEYDSSADLYYFWQRWYDSNSGLFISIDKYDRLSRFKNDIIEYHQYWYCRSNPMMMIDPDGFSEHMQKCEDAFNEIQEIEKLEGLVLSCFTNCKTACMSNSEIAQPGLFMIQCLRACKCGNDCAMALAKFYVCLAKAPNDPKAAIKCAKELKGCAQYVQY